MDGWIIYLLHLTLLGFISVFFLLVNRRIYPSLEWTFRSTFFSLFFGTLLLSTGFAVIKTGGKTIMLGFLLLAIFYFFEKRTHPIVAKKSYPSNPQFLFIGLFFGAFFVFSWSFLTIGQFDAFPFHIPSGTAISQNDYLINVFRSYYLAVTGCLLYTSPSPRDATLSRMPSSA